MTHPSGTSITLHLGAHRCASAAVADVLDRERDALATLGQAVWLRPQTRDGRFAGILGDPGRRVGATGRTRAEGRISLWLQDLARDGYPQLTISDPAFLGSLRENVTLGRLYPSVGARMERLAGTLGAPERVALCIRPPHRWWSSAFAFLIGRGVRPPSDETLAAIAAARRGWRQVIEDIARAMPRSDLLVWTLDDLGRDPARVVKVLTGHEVAGSNASSPQAAPSARTLEEQLETEGAPMRLPQTRGRFAPFTSDQIARMAHRFEDDLDWLRRGADGAARLVTAPASNPRPDMTEGWNHDRRQ